MTRNGWSGKQNNGQQVRLGSSCRVCSARWLLKPSRGACTCRHACTPACKPLQSGICTERPPPARAHTHDRAAWNVGPTCHAADNALAGGAGTSTHTCNAFSASWMLLRRVSMSALRVSSCREGQARRRGGGRRGICQWQGRGAEEGAWAGAERPARGHAIRSRQPQLQVPMWPHSIPLPSSACLLVASSMLRTLPATLAAWSRGGAAAGAGAP